MMTQILTRRRATLLSAVSVLALALLTSGCASGSSSTSPASSTGDLSSEEIYNEYDKDNRSCREVGGNCGARLRGHGGADQAARSRSVGERSRVGQPSTRRRVI